MQNFTVADLLQSTLAIFSFAVFLFPSGYLLGLASDLFGFRRRSSAEKILFSVIFSIASTPILAVLLTRFLSYTWTLAFFLLLVVVSVAALIREFRPKPLSLSRIAGSTWLMLALILLWFVVVQLSLDDLQIGHRLYVSCLTYDHSVRVPFVEAAARSGVPPLNPFYGLGKVPILRYYYYWYVVCALPMRLFGLSARGCFNASIFWSGLGLASAIPLFLKHFLGEKEDLRRKSVIGVALLAITGLDLLPYAAVCAHYRLFLPDMEWWDSNQVASWLGSLLWVPHHVASMTACIAGLLVISTIDEETSTRPMLWVIVVSALAFASAAGLSAYVMFTFAVFGIVWALYVLLQRQFKVFACYVASATLSLLLSWPLLSDLLSRQASGDSASEGGFKFAFFAIRDNDYAMRVLTHWGLQNPFLLNLAKLPVMVLTYALEFGFFAIVVSLTARRDWRDRLQLSRQRRIMWTMFAVSMVIMSIMKSNSSGVNDLGFRGMLVAQFVLLMWAVPIIHDSFFQRDIAKQIHFGGKWIRGVMVVTLAIGAAGTAWQLIALRAYAPLADAGRVERSERLFGSAQFGKRTYWLREGFKQINEMTPPTAFVQFNPVRDEGFLTRLYSARQTVMSDANCGSAFGGDRQKCRDLLPYFVTVFNEPSAMINWNPDPFCADFHINVLVATDADPVWQDRTSWVWSRPTLVSNPALRAITCSDATQ
jgi:hypothetical protein